MFLSRPMKESSFPILPHPVLSKMFLSRPMKESSFPILPHPVLSKMFLSRPMKESSFPILPHPVLSKMFLSRPMKESSFPILPHPVLSKMFLSRPMKESSFPILPHPVLSKLFLSHPIPSRDIQRSTIIWSLCLQQVIDQGMWQDLPLPLPAAGYRPRDVARPSTSFRVQESLRRFDPERTLMRALSMHTVRQRKYSVPAPNCLWHIDGNHKLIRIERLWRDVFSSVLGLFYQIFYNLEAEALLNPDNEIHLYAFHWAFLPQVQRHLQFFKEVWNNHKLRTEGNQSPVQLWLR
ncbi:UNVERIFIED_CONTAM: hypothetical protein FKN15_032326 [Acipenser sinensis]